jgi:hypothetical protein
VEKKVVARGGQGKAMRKIQRKRGRKKETKRETKMEVKKEVLLGLQPWEISVMSSSLS